MTPTDYLLIAASVTAIASFVILVIAIWVLRRARQHLKREQEIETRRKFWDKRNTLTVIKEDYYQYWVAASRL